MANNIKVHERTHDPYCEAEEKPQFHEQTIDPWNYGWALILTLAFWSLIGVGFLVAGIFVKNFMLGVNFTIIGWIVIAGKATDAFNEVKRAWEEHKEILSEQ